jgi:hypothetical protein
MSAAEVERGAALLATVAGSDLAQVVPGGGEVLLGSDVAQVIAVAVGAADHVAAAAQGEIGEDGHVAHADRAERAGVGAEPLAHLIGMSGPDGTSAQRLAQFGFAQLMIAAQQHEHRRAFGHHDERLDLGGFGQAGELGDFGDGADAGRGEGFGLEIAGRDPRPGVRRGWKPPFPDSRRSRTAGREPPSPRRPPRAP